MEKTEWFPVSIKPVRDGDYETKTGNYPTPILRKYESGVWWVHLTDIGWTISGFDQWNWCGAEWRGLTENPHAD